MMIICRNTMKAVKFSNLMFLMIFIMVKGDFQSDVTTLGENLKKQAKQSLGITKLQDHFNSITSSIELTNITERANQILDKFSDQLKANTDVTKEILPKLKEFIENDYATGGEERTPKDCCTYEDGLTYSSVFQAEVNFRDFCEMTNDKSGCSSNSTSTQPPLLNEQKALTALKSAYNKGNDKIRHIYYGRNDGYYIQYPAQNNLNEAGDKCFCTSFDPRFRPWYVGVVTPPDGKDIVLAIDMGESMRDLETLLENVITVLLDTIDVKDRILVSIFRNGLRHANQLCLKKLTLASPGVVAELRNFITQQIKENIFTGGLSYTDVFKDVYNDFKDDVANDRAKTLYFVTSGEQTDKKSQAISEIESTSKMLNCTVTVNMFITTHSGTSDNKYTEYANAACSCEWCTKEDREKNKIFKYDKIMDHNIESDVSEIYDSNSGNETDEIVHFTMPYVDFNGLGTVIDACTRCKDQTNKIIGVACVGFVSTELFGGKEGVLEITEDSYVFLIDYRGVTYIHPKFSEPVFVHDRAFPLDITQFETNPDFRTKVYQRMMSNQDGSAHITVNTSISTGVYGAKFKTKNFTYSWKRVPASPFIIAVVLSDQYSEYKVDVSHIDSKTNERYHRLDLINSTDLCLVRKKISTNDSSVVKMTYEVFDKPFSYYEDEDFGKVQKLIQYFEQKRTNQPANYFRTSDIAINIRNYVVATNLLDELWKNDSSTDGYYIIWRYIGLEDGTTRLYPGTRLHPYYDPRIRPWYQLAKLNPENYIVTVPYVDAWSNTTLITFSKAIYKKESVGKHIAGVISMDISIPYLENIFTRYVYDCDSTTSGYLCILLNERGYLIYHPEFLNGMNGNFGNEIHITKKEPILAKYLIDIGIMKKSYCIGYFKTLNNDEAPVAHLQWFYDIESTYIQEMNTCKQFKELAPVEGTNMFVLKFQKGHCSNEAKDQCACPSDIKQTCNYTASISDYKNFCECPCYQYQVCLDALPPLTSSLICQPPNKVQNLEADYSTNWNVDKNSLDDCLDPKCYLSGEEKQCNRLNCKWCYRNGTKVVADNLKHCTYERNHCFHTPITTTPVTTPTATPTATATEKTQKKDAIGNEIIIPIVVIVIIILILLIAGLLKYFLNKQKKHMKDGREKPVEIGATRQTFNNIAIENDDAWI